MDEDPTPRKFRRDDRREKTRRCMYCGEVVLSRGMGPHVRNSVGNGHGESGAIPEDYDLEKCEVVGERTVSVNERVTGDTESGNEFYVCRLCGHLSKGYRGYTIHMARSEGKGRHPDDGENIDEQMYSVIPATENWEPVDDNAVTRALNTVYEKDDKVISIPIIELYKIRSHLNDPDLDKEVAADELTGMIERYA